MKVVNLSRRPFLNDRPVKRFSVILWLLGGLLLLANLWLYGSYFSGTSKGESRLQALSRQIDQEEAAVEELSSEVRSLKLTVRNDRAEFLNDLIHARTFPWSALFDSLEDVMPIDAFLVSVKPNVLKEDKPKTTRRRSRARTAREARQRARERRAGNTEPQPAVAEETKKKEPEDRVLLALQVTSRNEQAMMELVENLHGNPSFDDPILKTESIDATRNVGFSISAIFLPPRLDQVPPEEGMPGSEVLAEGNAAGPGAAGEGTGRETDGGERQVQRAEAQDRVGLPPEEGEGAGDRQARPPLPSRASVAAGARDRGAKRPGTAAEAPSRRGAASRRTTPGAANRGSTNRRNVNPRNPNRGTAESEQPSSRRQTPTTRPRNRGSIGQPIPVAPAASSAPRLRGSLLDKWLPRWAPAGPSQAPGFDSTWTLASWTGGSDSVSDQNPPQHSSSFGQGWLAAKPATGTSLYGDRWAQETSKISDLREPRHPGWWHGFSLQDPPRAAAARRARS